jgi:hypothetical protein
MRRASTKNMGRGRVMKSTGSEVGRGAFLLKRPTMSVLGELRVEVLGDHRHTTGHELRCDLL